MLRVSYDAAPFFRATSPAQRAEIEAVIDNVVNSAINQAVKEEKKRVAGKASRKPRGDGYRRILIADLAARGWVLSPKATP